MTWPSPLKVSMAFGKFLSCSLARCAQLSLKKTSFNLRKAFDSEGDGSIVESKFRRASAYGFPLGTKTEP